MTIQERPRGQVVEYPTSDGKPMAESDIHLQVAIYVIQALQDHFEGQTVYVAGNNFLYYEEGNPRACVSPDAYVVFGVTMALRDCYKAWEEGGKLPDVVFEFTSRSTRGDDLGRKRQRYEQRLGVQEYFLFDPRAEYLQPPLQGFRLEQGGYVPLEPVEGRLHSERLGLDLVQEGRWLRLWNPQTHQWLLTRREIREQAETARLRANEEAQRAAAAAAACAEAEAENARLRAELEALRLAASGKLPDREPETPAS